MTNLNQHGMNVFVSLVSQVSSFFHYLWDGQMGCVAADLYMNQISVDRIPQDTCIDFSHVLVYDVSIHLDSRTSFHILDDHI